MAPQVWIGVQVFIDLVMAGLLVWFIRTYGRRGTSWQDHEEAARKAQVILEEMDRMRREPVTPAELNKEISGGKFRPVYFFFGSEEYRIKEAEKALVQKFLGIHARNGHKSLAASRLKASDIFTELSIVPMLGDRQVFSDIADLGQNIHHEQKTAGKSQGHDQR